MRSFAILFFASLVLAPFVQAQAQFQAPSRPDQQAPSSAPPLTPRDIVGSEGRYAFELLRDPRIRALLADALSVSSQAADSGPVSRSSLRDLERSMSVSVPSTLVDGRFLVATGCERHNCGFVRGLFVLDSRNPGAVLVARRAAGEVRPEGAAGPDVQTLLSNARWNAVFGPGLGSIPRSLIAEIDRL